MIGTGRLLSTPTTMEASENSPAALKGDQRPCQIKKTAPAITVNLSPTRDQASRPAVRLLIAVAPVRAPAARAAKTARVLSSGCQIRLESSSWSLFAAEYYL